MIGRSRGGQVGSLRDVSAEHDAVKLGEEKFYKFMSEMIVDWHRTGRIVELEKKYGMGNTSYALQMHAKYKK